MKAIGVHGAKRSDTVMVCNGLYVHSLINTDYNRNALLRKAEFPVEEHLSI